MIRVNVLSTGGGINREDLTIFDSQPKNRTLKGFDIYRLKEGEPESKWIKLSNNLTSTEYIDTQWNTLPIGDKYQYAIKAIYTTGIPPARISNPLSTLGIDDSGRMPLSNLILYPNPFTNEIFISNPELVKSIEIMDIAGKKLQNTVFKGKSILTENLGNGFYFVTVEGFDGEKVVFKVVK